MLYLKDPQNYKIFREFKVKIKMDIFNLYTDKYNDVLCA